MQITTRHARQRNGAIKRPNPISGKPKMYAIGIFSGVPSIVDVTAHRDDASKNENTVIQPKSVARPNLFEESIGVLFKRHNLSVTRDITSIKCCILWAIKFISILSRDIVK